MSKCQRAGCLAEGTPRPTLDGHIYCDPCYDRGCRLLAEAIKRRQRRRQRRTELEKFISDVVVRATIEHNPELRASLRELLDKGISPDYLRRRYGYASRQHKPYDHGAEGVALTVDWLIDEWEREKGLVKPDESIDLDEAH